MQGRRHSQRPPAVQDLAASLAADPLKPWPVLGVAWHDHWPRWWLPPHTRAGYPGELVTRTHLPDLLQYVPCRWATLATWRQSSVHARPSTSASGSCCRWAAAHPVPCTLYPLGANLMTVFCGTKRNVLGRSSYCCCLETGLETCHLQAFVGDVWCFRTTTSASNILHIPSAPTAVVQVVEESNGRWLIASDHGNSDDMVQVSCASNTTM